MSGGHYNYANHYIGSLAEDIMADVKKFSKDGKDPHGYEYAALPKDILAAMKKVAKKLEGLSEATHDIDYLMAGDYGDDTFRDCVKEWKI